MLQGRTGIWEEGLGIAFQNVPPRDTYEHESLWAIALPLDMLYFFSKMLSSLNFLSLFFLCHMHIFWCYPKCYPLCTIFSILAELEILTFVLPIHLFLLDKAFIVLVLHLKYTCPSLYPGFLELGNHVLFYSCFLQCPAQFLRWGSTYLKVACRNLKMRWTSPVSGWWWADTKAGVLFRWYRACLKAPF